MNSNIPYEYQRLYEHQKWVLLIPYLQFGDGYKIKIVPPFGGAVIRFIVKKGKKQVSVYLDCYQSLGYYGSSGNDPYWEIYPGLLGDCERFAMENSKGLIRRIKRLLDKRGLKK